MYRCRRGEGGNAPAVPGKPASWPVCHNAIDDVRSTAVVVGRGWRLRAAVRSRETVPRGGFRPNGRCRPGGRRSIWAMPVKSGRGLRPACGLRAIEAGFALPRDAGLETGAPIWGAVRVGAAEQSPLGLSAKVRRNNSWQRTLFAAIRFGESVKGGFPRSQNYNEHRNSPERARGARREFRCPARSAGRFGRGRSSPHSSRRVHRPDNAPPTGTPDLRAGFALTGDAGLETGVPIGRCRSGVDAAFGRRAG